MALYTIGEVALLCDINPVTLRAWQRRYGLLKPQRTDGGHRLFNDADIDRIREIKRWIDNGVQVSKVKMLLSNENVDVQNGWRDQQETLLTYLQSGNLHSLRTWIKERGQDYPAQTLTTHLFIPLRRRQGKDALVVGWNIQDTTRLWLEGWIASQQGWRIDVLAHSLNQLRPELFEGRTLLVWCGENRTSAQQQQLTSWQEQGHDIFPLGI
ncbi:MAG: MerR family transcriptional regulator [Escherichia coli]|nr:MerR family transcriptional regulator [Escherichia coli]